MSTNFRLFPCILAFALPAIACDRETTPAPGSQAAPPVADPAPIPSASAEPAPVEPAPVPAAPAAIVPKTDAIDTASLKAGLDAILPRVRSKVAAFTKVEPKENHRFFMHPDEAKNAVIEFDTKGLKSLTLAPYIEDFSGNPDCTGNPQAGVVQFTWSLDGGEKHPLTVDRSYNGTVDVKVGNAARLKIEVDKGNEVTWCDWASVGIINVVK